MKLNMTQKWVDSLEPSPQGRIEHRDEKAIGLLVRVNKTGASYAVQGDLRQNGRVRTRKVTLGPTNRISLAQARRRAAVIMSDIKAGIDPTAGPKSDGITLAEAFERHLAERSLAPATVENMTSVMDSYLAPLRKRAASSITRAECHALFDKIRKRSGLSSAKLAHSYMRAILNTARRHDETIKENVSEAVLLPSVPPRKVQGFDVTAFWEATGKLAPMRRAIQRTFLLTGARRESVRCVKREDVDLDQGLLTFVHMKSGGPLLFPMGRYLRSMIAEWMAESEPFESPWLWPADSTSGHVIECRESDPAIPTSHVVRHAALSMMLEAKLLPHERNLLVGHAVGGMGDTYTHGPLVIELLGRQAQAYEDMILARAGEGA